MLAVTTMSARKKIELEKRQSLGVVVFEIVIAESFRPKLGPSCPDISALTKSLLRVAILFPAAQRAHAFFEISFLAVEVMRAVVTRWFADVIQIISLRRIH